MITISVCTDEERQAVARAVEDGSLTAALGVPFEVDRVSTGPGGGAGTARPWITIHPAGLGAATTRGSGGGGHVGPVTAVGGAS